MNPPETLEGTVALIMGGGGDIGFAIGAELAARGGTVVLADIDTDQASRLTGDTENGPGSISVESVDLSSRAATIGLVERVVAQLGSIGALVNAAAVTRRGQITEIPEEAWEQMVAVNLSAVFWSCQATIPHMVEAGRGVILNIGSIAALRGLSGSPAYAATKGGVVSLSRALAMDHARDGIRIYSLNPPAVDTRLYRAMFDAESDPALARKDYEESQPSGRVLTTAEVAALAAFLVEGRGPFFSPEPIFT